MRSSLALSQPRFPQGRRFSAILTSVPLDDSKELKGNCNNSRMDVEMTRSADMEAGTEFFAPADANERSAQELLPTKSVWKTPVNFLEQCYGRNIGFYFLYLRWSMFLCLCTTIPGLVLLILQTAWRDPPSRSLATGPLDLSPYLYIAFYDPEMFWYWRGATIANGTIVALFAFLYIRFLRSQKQTMRDRDPFAGQQSSGFEGTGTDAIVENQNLSLAQRTWGKFLSSFVFLFILGTEAIVNYYLATAMVGTNDTALAATLSLILSIFNAVWQLMCEPVTNLEKPVHFDQKFNSYFNKCVCFQMLSACILFSITHTNLVSDASMQEDRCPFELLAHEYPSAMLISVIAAPAFQIAIPLLQRMVSACRRSTLGRDCCGSKGTVQSQVRHSFPEFNLGDEYTMILYIQFMCLQGQVVFPLLPLVGFICFAIKFGLDKIRLFRYCRPLTTTKNAFGKRLFMWNMINVIIAFFLIPSGIFWIWRADRYFVDEAGYLKCRIYANIEN